MLCQYVICNITLTTVVSKQGATGWFFKLIYYIIFIIICIKMPKTYNQDSNWNHISCFPLYLFLKNIQVFKNELWLINLLTLPVSVHNEVNIHDSFQEHMHYTGGIWILCWTAGGLLWTSVMVSLVCREIIRFPAVHWYQTASLSKYTGISCVLKHIFWSSPTVITIKFIL